MPRLLPQRARYMVERTLQAMPCTVAELVAITGLKRWTIYSELRGAMAAGCVVRDVADCVRPVGKGRPATRYRLQRAVAA